MDLSNLKMDHGAPNWDAKHNDLVDAVQKVEEVTDQLQWSKTSCDGVVGSDGWEVLKEDRGSGYQILNLGGLKIVWLHLLIQRSGSDFTGSEAGYNISLPENIQPAVYGIGGKLDDPQADWYYWDGNHKIAFNANTSTYKWAEDHIYPISVIYIGKNS